MLLVQETIDGIADEERSRAPNDVSECQLVVLLCLLFFLGQNVFISDLDLVGEDSLGSDQFNIDCFGDLPRLYE